VAAYWIDKKGNFVESRDNHIIMIISHPERFGFTKKKVEDTYNKYGEVIGSEGKARRELIDDVISRGFIRIRLYPRSHWSITIGKFDSRTRSLVTEFANKIVNKKIDPGLGGKDVYMPVKLVAVKSRQENKKYTIKDIADGVLLTGEPVVETLNLMTFDEFLNESSLSRVWQHFTNNEKTVVILTAFRDEKTREENLRGNKAIAASLKNAGFGYFFVEGHYTENKGTEDEVKVKEESIFAIAEKNKSRNLIELAHKLANKYNQDSIFVKEGLGDKSRVYFYTKKGTKDKIDGKLSLGKVGEFYTKLNNKKRANTFVFESATTGSGFFARHRKSLTGMK